MQTTLCNQQALKSGDFVFYNFAYYSKDKDEQGDIVYYNATLNYKNEYRKPCNVAVQNGKVLRWQA